MARYIAPEVDELVSDNPAGETHRVVLVVESSDYLDTLSKRAEEFGVSVVESIEPRILVVEIEDGKIDDFCQPGYIESVSFDEGLEAMQGNPQPPQA